MAKVTIETPNSASDPADVVTEEIFVPDTLPPGEGGAAPAGQATARPALKPREVEALDFEIEGEMELFHKVPLKHPFRRNGDVVRAIFIRRLTVAEVGDLIDARPADLPDLFDIYAIMAGHPAPVLRGLVDIDGEAVAEVCYDFLPRYFRPRTTAPDASSSSLLDGAAS